MLSDLPAEVEVGHGTLFEVGVWNASVDPTTWWIAELICDIDSLLANEPQDVARSSGFQTRPELQERGDRHWRAFFDFVTVTFNHIVATAPQHRYPRFGLRSWALRVDAASVAKDLAYGATRVNAHHNHSPSLLTSVFTCELPSAPEPENLSTIVYNPAFHVNCPWQPRLATLPPRVGTLTVFPGWLEHSAPIVAPIPEGERRIIISTDYFPEF